MNRPRLLFISPRFLFPPHSGGAIRTGQILRGMKGGRFHIKLLSPGSPELESEFRDQLSEVADEWLLWPAMNSEDRSRLSKVHHLLSSLPLTVAADRSKAAREIVREAFATGPDVVVADFLHAAVQLPESISIPTVLFTHNCEAEIYERHAANERSAWMKPIWRSQARKMLSFERDALAGATKVVAVSERDAQRFERSYGLQGVETIPTGVELERFPWREPQGQRRVVFAGSMDSAANIDGVEWLLDHVWPRVVEQVSDARMTVVGKSPPAHLVRKVSDVRGVEFTGRVAEVAPYLSGADAFVIPLRVGSGTRMKAYEAMASGVPVVSTSVGIEGLGLLAGVHYLEADSGQDFAEAILRLISDPLLGREISCRARSFVDEHASHLAAAKRFEEICLRAAGLLPRIETEVGGGTPRPVCQLTSVVSK